MRCLWKVLGDSLGGFRCVTLQGTGELCLSGRLGDIWVEGPGRYKAYIICRNRSEKIISFDSKQLSKYVLKLNVPPNPEDQVWYANNPNFKGPSWVKREL